ncbi:hypothetical protein BJV74DRAFT_797787 [Russula compacta]|nr:hypothetical protein BJV74DRAFT_797787 [Russula compacta]
MNTIMNPFHKATANGDGVDGFCASPQKPNTMSNLHSGTAKCARKNKTPEKKINRGVNGPILVAHISLSQGIEWDLALAFENPPSDYLTMIGVALILTTVKEPTKRKTMQKGNRSHIPRRLDKRQRAPSSARCQADWARGTYPPARPACSSAGSAPKAGFGNWEDSKRHPHPQPLRQARAQIIKKAYQKSFEKRGREKAVESPLMGSR